jgi:hypothetical protein
MPEQDFELYLSLLSRFLRLKTPQRAEIADELRDHLEARLEELAAQGMARDQAIKAALEEFGDAAELANHFTQVAHIRKRRLIMRFTFGTALALTFAVVVATAFWPAGPQSPAPTKAVAQNESTAVVGDSKTSGVPARDDDKGAVEAKLSKRIGKLDFDNAPLRDVLEFLSDLIDVDILVNNARDRDDGFGGPAEEAGIDTNMPVHLQVKRANLSARTALDLVLEPHKLSYTVRDGLIMVTTAAAANQIQVYNIRDLVWQGPVNAQGGGSPAMMGMGKGPGRPGMMGSSMPMSMGPGGPIAGAGGMDAAGGMGGGGGPVVRETESLADVIAVTIDPASWDSAGGTGSIIQYHELLVVKNSQAVHGKIKTLLDMMRTTAQGAAAHATPPIEPPGGIRPAGPPGALSPLPKVR